MERSRHGKSRSVSGIEEIPKMLKYKSVTRYSACWNSYIDGTSTADKHKVEPKRRSQSVIARLLGLKNLMNRELYDGRSCRDRNELRKTCDDLEAPFVPNRRSSRWSPSSMPSKFDMLLVKQKLRDFECFSADEKLKATVDADETLDLFYSNKHSSVKFVERQDSRFTDNVHDQTRKCDGNAFTGHPRVQRRDGLLLEPYYSQRTHVSSRSSKARTDRSIPHPRIVVLRPTPYNITNAYEADPFDRDIPVFGNIKDFSNNRRYKTVSKRRNDSACMGLKNPASKEAKETTGEIIARQARSGREDTVDAKSHRFRGYVPYADTRGNGELEISKFPAKHNSNDQRGRKGQSPGLLSERSTNADATQKKLVERWRTTRKYRDLELVYINRREMVASSGGERRSKHVYANKGPSKTTRDDPFGIRGKDSDKNDDNSSPLLSRSRPSILHLGGPPIHRSESRTAVRKSGKKSTPIKLTHASEISSSTDDDFEFKMEANVKQLSERVMKFQMPSSQDDDSKANAGNGKTSLSSSESSSQLLPEQSSLPMDGDELPEDDQKGYGLQELNKGKPEDCYIETELDSSETQKKDSSGNTDSTLEVPFNEDSPSNSDCFQTVGTELQELRTELQLLKMECEEKTDASSSSSSDLITPQLPPIHSQETSPSENESWEFSYILDVLINSGLQDSDFDLFALMWHCLDSPLDPSLFEELEKQFEEDMNESSNHQRRSLFDRVNTSLSEILKQSIDLYPWVMPKLASTGHSRSHREVVLNAFERVIRQEFVDGEMIESSLLDNRLQRFEYKGEIDGIGNEIEEMLIDGLIVEFLS